MQSDMSLHTRLHRRKSVYYFRAKIPADLQPVLGKREEKFSLRTQDPTEARKRVRAASKHFDDKCDAARSSLLRAGQTDVRNLDEALIQDICDTWRNMTLSGDEWVRQNGMTDAEFDLHEEGRQGAQDVLKRALARGHVDVIEPVLAQFLSLIGMQLIGDPETHKRLAYKFMQTVAEVHGLQIRRDEGEVVATPDISAPPLRPKQAHMVSASKGPALDELYDMWRKLNPHRPQSTVSDVERTLRDFKTCSGKENAQEVDRRDVIAYRDKLIADGLASKTVSKKVAWISALFNQGIDAGLLTINPAQRLPMPKRDDRPRQPFDTQDLKRIFRSEIFTKGKFLTRGVGEASQWIPLIALFQGCRLEEIAQLGVDDVKEIDGVWCCIIDTDSDHKKRLKNSWSRRRLPIHDEVIRAGFLKYLNKVSEAGHERVFPSLKPGKDGKYSPAFSKAFNQLIHKELGFDKDKVFHSFRHTFRDACREAGLDEEISDALMGHSNSNRMGRRYGNSFSIARLSKAMKKINYEGLKVPVIFSE